MINRIKIEFTDAVMEHLYRESYLKKDATQSIIAAGFCIIPVMFFLISDFILFGLSGKFFILLALRMCMITLIAALIIFLRFSEKYRMNDIVTLTLWLVSMSVIFYIYSTRPQKYTTYAVYDIVMILSIYLLAPNRFIFQLIPALAYSLSAIIYFLFFNPGFDIVIVLRALISLIFVNILGIFISYRIHYLRRLEFVALKKEVMLRAELEEALKNVRTLSGLLPICSHCHKIRNDEGYWKSIENYIEEHSEAQFTHSICNDCVEKLYGSEKWFGKIKNGK